MQKDNLGNVNSAWIHEKEVQTACGPGQQMTLAWNRPSYRWDTTGVAHSHVCSSMISTTRFKHRVGVMPFLGVPFNTGNLGCLLVLMNGTHHASGP